ncbi:MAG: ATP-binding protein [Pirellulaceae bacterium]
MSVSYQVDHFFEQLKPCKTRSVQDARDAKTLLLFTGEPGTGKTSTMQEAVRRAVGLSFQVYEGRCFDGSTSSFSPVIEIVRQIFTNLAAISTER